MSKNKAKIIYPDTEWGYLEIKNSNTRLSVYCKDVDNEVEVFMQSCQRESQTQYLSQDDIKLLITFLQKQIVE